MSEMYGGIPVAPGGAPGEQVTGPGQLQYGEMLLGGGTSAGWRELINWRDAAGVAADSPRPQAHGSVPGRVLSESVMVTYTFLLRNRTLAERAEAIAALERYAPMDGVDRMLAVNDADDGVWFRMARVVARFIPQDAHFRHAPIECSIQFLCADPLRYNLDESAGTVTVPESTGGLVYPLDYDPGLDYGVSFSGSMNATNNGSAPTPLVAVFDGPRVNPTLRCEDWQMAFGITLAAGETLVVDTGAGTALLNGDADRLPTIRSFSDPLDRCLLKPGTTSLTLTATSGTGVVHVSYRDARL